MIIDGKYQLPIVWLYLNELMYTIIKLLISSSIIVVVSEISKKTTFFGGLIASIPLISVLSIIWLYIETKNIENIKNLSYSIFWMVIPSLSLFVSLPILLKSGFNFYLSLILSILIAIVCYTITIFILSKYGIKL